jgi:hypothetical protein
MPSGFKFAFVPDPEKVCTEWALLPTKTFWSIEEAKAVAAQFVSLWADGGFDEESQLWWARDRKADGSHRYTQFEIVPD